MRKSRYILLAILLVVIAAVAYDRVKGEPCRAAGGDYFLFDGSCAKVTFVKMPP